MLIVLHFKFCIFPTTMTEEKNYAVNFLTCGQLIFRSIGKVCLNFHCTIIISIVQVKFSHEMDTSDKAILTL